MKRILIISPSRKRRETIGLIGGVLSAFQKLDKSIYFVALFDTNFFDSNHNPSDYDVDCYYRLKECPFDALMRKIPIVRSAYAIKKTVKTYKKILSQDHFDVVYVHQIPSFADELVSIAHANGSIIVFEPLGSDILRVSGKTQKKIKAAFTEVDYVVGRTKSNVLIATQEIYNVPKYKIKEQREALSGVIMLKNIRGKLSRDEMHKEIGIPVSAYNIVCGYSGRESHRHRAIIDALIQVKDVLPKGYQIIFPMTYGAGQHHEIIIDYASQLKAICDEAALNTFFMTDFKTFEQMAYLHLITDLFIEIQPTDNGNAFMIEALFAQNQIVTGRWLNYQRFEQFGEPYYLIDKPEDLAVKLRDIFSGKEGKAVVPKELIDFFDVPDGYDRGDFYLNLFENI